MLFRFSPNKTSQYSLLQILFLIQHLQSIAIALHNKKSVYSNLYFLADKMFLHFAGSILSLIKAVILQSAEINGFQEVSVNSTLVNKTA